MPFDFARARPLLQSGNFPKLFVEELGWEPCRQKLTLRAAETDFAFAAIAEKRGFVTWLCECKGSELPDHTTRLKLDRALTQTSFEHLIIFATGDRAKQSWMWVRREPGRPLRPRTHDYLRSQPGDSLLQKLQHLYISFAEEEAGELSTVAVAGRARSGFDVERVTKKFYDQFKQEHAAFLRFIKGIPVKEDAEWYASVMLNRMMFVYFIQRKGFLDGDPDYLRNRLARCQQEKGKDKFYSFYRYFLLRLFNEGFGKRRQDRAPDLEKLLGNIPYLNGGMFDVHELEKPDRYGNDIQIADSAFRDIFDYFDQYDWVLDPERTARKLGDKEEINPDVLGYIFEKYINQKQMGAYYTKEDITEYISKNTILPFLFDSTQKECKIAFENPSGPTVWDLLREKPVRYIYPALQHGMDKALPPDIVAGLHDVSKRTHWNKPAPAEYGLPTEIWREVVARRTRCKEIGKKLAAGEVRDINDLITLNLDIRQFAQDVVEHAEGPDLLRAFWHAIEKVTVLDPTCGSGAFLFAALNILEPLYEACLDRMAGLVEDLDNSNQRSRPEKYSDFRKVLAQVASHPNARYFIFKSIILNNLFGVDIMEEAVEICKLRLFLKLAAQVDPDNAKDNLGIEPLPDIDFNIRAGNTLVGYATANEVRKCMQEFGSGQMRLGVEDELNSYARFAEKVELADVAFGQFREMQTERGMEAREFVKAKQTLRDRLNTLAEELNRYLAGEYDVKLSDKAAFEKWVNSHQPFHWFVEFYGIICNGGFDVIIGNPPYVEIPKDLNRSLLQTTFRSALEKWSRDEDLYTLVVERSLHLLRARSGQFGMILPLSLTFSTKRPFVALRTVMAGEKGLWCLSHFDRIPSALFGNEVRTRNTVSLLSRNSKTERFLLATTSLLRWNAEFRDNLFSTIHYANLDLDIVVGIPKVATQIQADALEKLIKAKTPLIADLSHSIPFSDLSRVAPNFPQYCVYVGGTAYNWFPAWRDIPETTNMSGQPSLPARTAGFRFNNDENANIVFALLCCSLGYWWWAIASDGFNLKKWLIERFPISISLIPVEARRPLAQLGSALRRELKCNYVYKDNKGRIGNYFLPACEKEVIAIDDFLARFVPGLSRKFFEDIRNFNASFSRAEIGDEEIEEDI